jgi:Tol biopolymer transport system component
MIRRCLLALLVSCGGYHGPATLFDTVDSTPRLVGPGLISTGDDDAHATLSPDGNTIYFLRDTPSFDLYTILYSERSSSGWTQPRVVSFSGQYPDGDLAFTPDGKHAYFVSSRPVEGKPRTDTEIWTVDVVGHDRWSPPRHVPELASPADEWFPTFASDGTLYFGSCREGGLGGCDIYRSHRRDDGTFTPPENLGAPVNTAANEIEPMIAPDQRFLIVSVSGRPDSVGSYDLYVSRREGETWQPPVHLPAPINSTGWDFGPRLSPDGRWLFFTSNRGYGSEPLPAPLDFAALDHALHSPHNGLRDIYVVDARVLEPASGR